MNSVTLNAERGRTLRLTRTDEQDAEHGTGFDARLTITDGAVEGNVYEYQAPNRQHRQGGSVAPPAILDYWHHICVVGSDTGYPLHSPLAHQAANALN